MRNTAQGKAAPRVRRGRRGSGVDVRPEALRAARLEAGLTMAQLAAGELTRGAIYLFESGRARPSRESLELIAAATRKPVSFFLAEGGDATVERATARVKIERAVREGDYEGALRLADELSSRTHDPRERVLLDLRRAESQLVLGQADAALDSIHAARGGVADVPDEPELDVECALVEAQILVAVGDPSAQSALELTLDLSRALPTPRNDFQARIHMLQADLHAREERWDAALESAEAAEKLSRLGDLLRAATAAHDAAAARHETAESGVDRLVEATRALEVAAVRHDIRLATAARLQQATLLAGREEHERATELLEGVLGQARWLGDEQLEADASLELADVYFSVGDVDRAAVAIEVAAASDDALARASAQLLRGKIAAATGAPPQETDAAFRKAIAAFAELDALEELAGAHAAFAATLEARGAVREALAEWKRAATRMRPGLAATAQAPPSAAEGYRARRAPSGPGLDAAAGRRGRR